MGCPRLTYREKEERLNFLGLWKKSDGSKNGEDYYPFGLSFNEYSRENSVPNKYLFNKGSERQDDLGLNVYQTHYRMFDPALGRWWQVDPKADEGHLVDLTPYNFADDDPIRYNDPDGDSPIDGILRMLAKQGVKWAARTTKGSVKPVSRQAATKILQNKGTVYQVEITSNKASKALMKEAAPNKVIKRHDAHQAKQMDHFQDKNGGGAHVNFVKGTAAVVATAVATTANAQGAPQSQLDKQGTMGKSMFGDNAVGNFYDNFINPVSLVKDLRDLVSGSGDKK